MAYTIIQIINCDVCLGCTCLKCPPRNSQMCAVVLCMWLIMSYGLTVQHSCTLYMTDSVMWTDGAAQLYTVHDWQCHVDWWCSTVVHCTWLTVSCGLTVQHSCTLYMTDSVMWTDGAALLYTVHDWQCHVDWRCSTVVHCTRLILW